MAEFTPYADLLLILKDHGSDVDISNAWTVIEWEETIPQSIKITLSASFGQFLTKGDKIKKFDRIYIQYTANDGNIEKDVFHVRNLNRKRQSGRGKQLVLTCPHQSENLWKRTTSLVNRRTSGFDVLENIIEQINLNKGTSDPVILSPIFDITTKTGNNLSPETRNDYIFEMKNTKEVFDEIADIESQPVEGGGTFQPPYIRFKSNYDHSTGLGVDEVNIQAYAQGFNKNDISATFTNIPNVTLSHYPREDVNESLTNILQNDSDEDPERATNIILRCGQLAGDYLGDWTKYQGAKDFFDSAQPWQTGRDYTIGNLVNEVGLTYESITSNTSSGANQPPNAAFWIQRTFTIPVDWSPASVSYVQNDLVKNNKIAYKALIAHTSSVSNEPPNNAFWVRVHYPPTVDYSPETKNRAQDWINALAGAKYANVNDGKTRIFDANIIIPDVLHPRTYVRFVGTDPASIPASLLIGGTRIPDAFKMLVINPATGEEIGSGEFAVNDPNGIPFAGNVAQYVDLNLDGTGTWFVFKKIQTAQDQEIVDVDEGDSWVKEPCEGFGSFVDGNGVCNIGTRNTNWVKGSYQIIDFLDVSSIFGDLGVLVKFGHFVAERPFECLHRVKFDTINGRIDMGSKTILNTEGSTNSAIFIKSQPRIAPSVNQIFDWNDFIGLNFWSLTPVSDNAIPFGAVSVGEITNLPTFDFTNMNRAPDGSRKLFGPEIEHYYPIQSFASWIELITTFASGSLLENTIDTKGDYSFGIFMIDRNDNTKVIDDITLGRTNDPIHMEGKLPGKQYKGVPGIPLFFNAKQPDTTDAFDPREFVVGGIFSKNSYDEQGRYKIRLNSFYGKSEIELAIDGWRKVKPLIITNLDEPNSLPSRNIETQPVTNESVIRYPQGKNLVLGLEKLFTFQRQNFKLDTSGRIKVDIRHGDPVYVTDPVMIDEATDSISNTIKMVADKITRTFSKTPKGQGGIIEKYSLITRLWP